MMTSRQAATPTTNPNRQRHDLLPIKGARIWYRRNHPKAPIEMVVSHGAGIAIIYELTREQVRQQLRELSAFYFDFPIDPPPEI